MVGAADASGFQSLLKRETMQERTILSCSKKNNSAKGNRDMLPFRLPNDIRECSNSDQWCLVWISQKKTFALMSYPVQVSSQIIYIPVSEAELTGGFKDVFNHLCYELPPSRPAWWIPDSERAVLWPHPLTQSSDLDVVKWGWDQWLFFVNSFIENTYPCIISGVSEVTVVTPLTTQFHSKLYKT